MEKFQRFVKRVPGLYSLAAFVREPRSELLRWRNYYRFRNRFRDILGVKSSATPRGKLLVIGLMGRFVEAIQQEAFLAKASQLKGLEPYILTSRSSWETRYFPVFGVDHFIYIEDYFTNLREREFKEHARRAMAGIHSFEDLMQYEYKGVKVGKYICSSLVRKTYTGTVGVKTKSVRHQIHEYLVSTMMNTEVAYRIFDSFKPDTVLFLERGYTPYGEFFDIAVNRGLNTIQWCGCHRDNSYMLKRYHRNNTDEHPASLAPKTWEMLRNLPWTKEHGKLVQQELFKNYSSGKWFSEVGTQFHSKLMMRDEIQKILRVDPAKKTAVIFPHLFWDATFFWGRDLFQNYREWYSETVKAACANKNLNWVIKVHPANIVKLNRDGYRGELVENQTLGEAIGKLPEHVKILPPDTKVSTYSLFDFMDYAVTVRGTIGIEAASFGIPVFTAGTGRYDRHGFTVDSVRREDYLEKMARIHTYPRLTHEQTELAQKFAFGTFILRPFDLKSLKISYKKDKTATQMVQYLISSKEDIFRALDLKAFGEWILNPESEDYVDMSKLK